MSGATWTPASPIWTSRCASSVCLSVGRLVTLTRWLLQLEALDQELRKYREQLKKTRGPAGNAVKQRAIQTLKRKKMIEAQREKLQAQSFTMEQVRCGGNNRYKRAVHLTGSADADAAAAVFLYMVCRPCSPLTRRGARSRRLLL